MEIKEKEEIYGFINWDGELENHQKICVGNILNCLNLGFHPIITSIPGSGKTVKSSVSLKKYGVEKLILIAPKGSIPKWEQALSKLFDKDAYEIYTYENIRNGKSPYVKKFEKDFIITEEWINLTENYKTCIILDEYHRLQNITLQTLAVSKLVRYIFKNSKPVDPEGIKEKTKLEMGRIVSISYTGCDKKHDLINQLYMFGYIDHYNSDNLKFSHFYDFMENVKKIGIIGVDEYDKLIINSKKIFMRVGKAAKDSKLTFLADICIRYILPRLTFFSVPDYAKNEKVKPDCANIMYEVDDDVAVEINNVFDGTIELIGNGTTRIIKKPKRTIKRITEQIETIKIPIYGKIAKNFLDSGNGKVIIMVLHLKSLNLLENYLKEYGVCRIEGKMGTEEREISNKLFQKNNSEKRVMLATIFTGCESIDLHDISKGGKLQRMLLIPPCYYTKAVVQSTGRVYRNGLTSKPLIRIVYTTYDGKSLEKKYHDSLETKTMTISSCHSTQQKDYLPCDYPCIKA